jgi:hypothetical protein
MDEARQEAKIRTRDIKEFQLLANDVEEITSDGEVTQEEINKLRQEIVRLRKLMGADGQ